MGVLFIVLAAWAAISVPYCIWLGHAISGRRLRFDRQETVHAEVTALRPETAFPVQDTVA